LAARDPCKLHDQRQLYTVPLVIKGDLNSTERNNVFKELELALGCMRLLLAVDSPDTP